MVYNGKGANYCRYINSLKLITLSIALYLEILSFAAESGPHHTPVSLQNAITLWSVCIVANVLTALLALIHFDIGKGIILENCASYKTVGVRDLASSVVLHLKALRCFLWIKGNTFVQYFFISAGYKTITSDFFLILGELGDQIPSKPQMQSSVKVACDSESLVITIN